VLALVRWQLWGILSAFPIACIQVIMNVAAFLASGIAAFYPESIGEPYEDGSGNLYLRLIGQPLLIYGQEQLNLVELGLRADRKVLDKIVDKLKFHQ
jgi:hypothetical protein